MSKYSVLVTTLLLLVFTTINLHAQSKPAPLRTFGYFQNSFFHQTEQRTGLDAINSFTMQQLNLFLQKDLAKHWRAFVNFEVLNNFSSSRRWGAFNIEEAWARYRASPKFSLKLGLLIPVFNHLNEIKNRTPLLPYIIRPIVYETSFGEFIEVEEFTPARAFVQATGYLPLKRVKFDYAVYVGNSPNIAQIPPRQEETHSLTGIDTTTTFLVGGRLGLRYEELKLGFSATRDHTNMLDGAEELVGGEPGRFNQIPRHRFGADLSYHIGQLSMWGEWISVHYLEDLPGIDLNKRFYYGTIGYRFVDRLMTYAGYWDTFQHQAEADIIDDEIVIYNGEVDMDIWSVGFAYDLLDVLILKAQLGIVDIDIDFEGSTYQERENFNHYSIAVSVMF